MPRWYSIHRAFTLGAIALAMVACATSSTADPFTTGPGHASVQGLVTATNGTPVIGSTVSVTCVGETAAIVPTDSNGRYIANLGASASAVDAGSGHVACHFVEPATGPVRAQMDVTLGFARGPVLVALQTVNLQEQ
jgi:hypothetical protein